MSRTNREQPNVFIIIRLVVCERSGHSGIPKIVTAIKEYNIIVFSWWVFGGF